jgi:hypothetical protein
MEPHTRRAVVYLAELLSGRKPNWVYDYSESMFATFRGRVSGTRVDAFDHDSGAHLTGVNGTYFHHGNMQYLTLKLNGDRTFSGYDYASSSHFLGRFKGSAIELYDYGAARYFSFTTAPLPAV